MCMCVYSDNDENRKRGRKELARRNKLAVDIATSRRHLNARSVRSVIAGSLKFTILGLVLHVSSITQIAVICTRHNIRPGL